MNIERGRTMRADFASDEEVLRREKRLYGEFALLIVGFLFSAVLSLTIIFFLVYGIFWVAIHILAWLL